jgi:four helix bundle protein
LFAALCIKTAEKLPKSFAGNYLTGQLIRSGSSPALHYGEAQAAESPKDFLHKMKVCLKELRETLNSLTLIDKLEWLNNKDMTIVIKECDELISIFVTSIKTASNNNANKKD